MTTTRWGGSQNARSSCGWHAKGSQKENHHWGSPGAHPFKALLLPSVQDISQNILSPSASPASARRIDGNPTILRGPLFETNPYVPHSATCLAAPLINFVCLGIITRLGGLVVHHPSVLWRAAGKELRVSSASFVPHGSLFCLAFSGQAKRTDPSRRDVQFQCGTSQGSTHAGVGNRLAFWRLQFDDKFQVHLELFQNCMCERLPASIPSINRVLGDGTMQDDARRSMNSDFPTFLPRDSG